MFYVMWPFLTFILKRNFLVGWVGLVLVVLCGSSCVPGPNVVSRSPSGTPQASVSKPENAPSANEVGGAGIQDSTLSQQNLGPGELLLDPDKPEVVASSAAPKTSDPGCPENATSPVAPPYLPWPQSPSAAMRPLTDGEVSVALADDLPLPPLLAAVKTEIDFLERSRRHETFVFGDRALTKAEYLQGLRRFLEIGQQSQNQEEFLQAVRQEFDFYEVSGPAAGKWGQAKVTAYYEPVLLGSSKKTKRFSQALYVRPSDLIKARVRLAHQNAQSCTSQGKRLKKKCEPAIKSEWKSSGYVSRARYVKHKKRWVLAPYYSRKQIDMKGALKGRHLELCWVDPLDAYFLQIEGSGTILLEKGKSFRLRPSDQNGHPFHGYSKALVAQANQAGLTVEQYLRSLPRKKMFSILNENPSYVFFELNENGANTSIGLTATAGRTIATDPRLFPQGALAFLVAKKPKFANHVDLKPIDWEPLSRFVLNQDTGGSIKGGGRVDLFWGEGPDAKRHADVINQQGQLYYLVPKVNSQLISLHQAKVETSETVSLLSNP